MGGHVPLVPALDPPLVVDLGFLKGGFKGSE